MKDEDHFHAERARRLQRARLKSGFATATQAARRFGYNENTYRSHENGERGLKTEACLKYAMDFSVKPYWLMFGSGLPRDLCYSRVIGLVEKEGLINTSNFLDYLPKTHVLNSFSTEIVSFCYVIGSDGMRPRYAKGDIVLVWEEADDLPRQEFDGVVWSETGERYFGGVVANEKLYTVEPIGTRPIRNLTATKIEPARAIVRAGCYDWVDNPPEYEWE